MKTFFIIFISFVTLSFIQLDNEANMYSFIGNWESFQGEIVNVKFNENNELLFERSFNNEMVSKGIIDVENEFLIVKRLDTLASYKLKYAFSRYEQTLVVEKPNSKEAWLLFKANYY